MISQSQMSPEQFEKITLELKKAQGFQTAAWNRVISAARKYALMKLHSSYLEGDSVSRVCSVDQTMYVKSYESELLFEIERAFLEDNLAGQALQRI